MKKQWIIGTRGSKLALRQTGIVVDRLQSIYPEFSFLIRTIQTKGDTVWDKPLHLLGGKGFFVKEIEDELLKGSVDMAVHSVKDLPAMLETGLMLGAVLEREDPRDAFISRVYDTLKAVPPGGKIGTGSLRRKSQVLRLNKGIEVVPIRGNVDTRIRKLDSQGLDGIILACAGVKRMGFQDHIREIIPVDDMIPASGQGAIGVEVRDEREVLELLRPINDTKSFDEITLERKLLGKIGGGCQIPLGIHARLTADSLTFYVSMGEEDGRSYVHCSQSYPRTETGLAVEEAFQKLKPFLVQ